MALTYQAEIENLIGPVTDTDALSQFLNDGIRSTLNMVRGDILQRMSQEYSVKTVGPPEYLVLGVSVDKIPARPVSGMEFALAGDATSMRAAHALSPVWTQDDDVFHGIKTLPAGTDIIVNAVPLDHVVSSTDEPAEDNIFWLKPVIVLYAAFMMIPAKIASAILALTNIDFPTSPGSPAFSYTDAAAGNAILPDLGTGGMYLENLDALTTRFATAVTTIDNEEDIELASGVLNEINTRINSFQATVQPWLQQLLQWNAAVTDISKFNRSQQLARQVQEYSAELGLYQAELGKVGARLQATQAEVGTLIALKKELESAYAQSLLPYLPARQA